MQRCSANCCCTLIELRYLFGFILYFDYVPKSPTLVRRGGIFVLMKWYHACTSPSRVKYMLYRKDKVGFNIKTG